MSENIHMLAGAYALNALPLEERAFFERHLATCEPCREEVAEYQATAAILGSAAAEAPPPHLRDRVLAAVDETRQVSPTITVSESFSERAKPYLSLVAAVLAFAVVALGSVSLYLAGQQDDLEIVEGLPAWLADADVVTVSGTEGVQGRFFYSDERDEGWLVIDGLEPQDPDRHDYQLWLFHDGAPVPAGVFMTSDDGRVAFRADASVRGAELVAVTLEPAGGLPQPSGEVLLSSEL